MLQEWFLLILALTFTALGCSDQSLLIPYAALAAFCFMSAALLSGLKQIGPKRKR